MHECLEGSNEGKPRGITLTDYARWEPRMSAANEQEEPATWKREHPMVGFRVSMEQRVHLDDLVRRSGLSLAELLRIGLGLVEPKIGDGQVMVPCRNCQAPIAIDVRSGRANELVLAALRKFQHHPACPPTSRDQSR